MRESVHGFSEKECGGGGAGTAGRVEGREGAGQETDGRPTRGERAEGGPGEVVQKG